MPHPLRVFKTQPVAAKVPEVTALFWVVKIATTAAGEAISDWIGLKQNVRWGFWSMSSMFCVALYIQFRVKRYNLVAVLVPRAGHRHRRHWRVRHHAPRLQLAIRHHQAFWLVVLGGVFYLWNRSEHTLDIHSITTNRREKYYWATVFATFSLGTAAGDFTAPRSASATWPRPSCSAASSDPLDRLEVPAFNAIFAFWFAYVITRPVGPSFADYFSKGHDLSGPISATGRRPFSSRPGVVLVASRRRSLRHPVARHRDRRRYLIAPAGRLSRPR